MLLVGALMAGTQLGMASLGTYPLAAFTSGCVGLVAIAGLARMPLFRGGTQDWASVETAPDVAARAAGSVTRIVPVREVLLALSAYLILVAIVLSASFIDPLTNLLNTGAIRLGIPETMTSFGWTNSATESYRTIAPFGEAGALLLYACAIGYLVYRKAGKLRPGSFNKVVSRTVSAALTSCIGIVTMVGMALMMMDSGMILMLARRIVDVDGPIFPFLSPFIGVLGAFMTGSKTNSNFLFGALQRDSAVLLSLPPAVLLAAQTTGGALEGGMHFRRRAAACHA